MTDRLSHSFCNVNVIHMYLWFSLHAPVFNVGAEILGMHGHAESFHI